jgi:tripartite-type tricarboxylate transporter receptor subunit TctC
MSAERDPEFPDVPTVAETFPDLTAVGFMSLAASAKTPDAIVRRLNETLNAALGTPEVQGRFAELGIPIAVVSPAEATAFVDAQRAIWVPLVQELEGVLADAKHGR